MRARSTRHRHRHCHCHCHRHCHDRGWHGAGSLRGGCLLVEGAIDIEAEHHALRPRTLRELTLERVREGAWALGPTLGRTPSRWPQRQSKTPYERGILQDIRDSFNVRFLFTHEREDCFGSPSRLSLSTQALNHIPFRFANARSNGDGGGGWKVEGGTAKTQVAGNAGRYPVASLPAAPTFPATSFCATMGEATSGTHKVCDAWRKRHATEQEAAPFLIPHSSFLIRARFAPVGVHSKMGRPRGL